MKKNDTKISMIAAIGKNRELGKDNKLLWDLPEDLARFRALTRNHVVIMGQKTFESIGKPLPKRINIILSKDRKFVPKGCLIAQSPQDALKFAQEQEKNGEIFIIGWGMIYALFLPHIEKLYLTLVEKEYYADPFFPPYQGMFSKEIFREEHKEGNPAYTFVELEK